MSDQTLDLNRSWRIVRRHLLVVLGVAVFGLAAGAAYTFLKPPLLSATAQVQLSTSSSSKMATQVVIAGGYGVLNSALPHVSPRTTWQDLGNNIKIRAQTSSIMSFTASGKTAAEAEQTANAVANSYVAYVHRHYDPDELQASSQQKAVYATGPTLIKRMILTAALGAILGLLAGVVAALAIGRSDKRLRLRDEIADAIGVPVLASIPVLHPTDARGWSSLLESYKPSAANAWRLRGALSYLGLPDVMSSRANEGVRLSITVLTLSSDSRALALGPQLAAFAASYGVSTALVVSSEETGRAMAALQAACAGSAPAGRLPSGLQLALAGPGVTDRLPEVALTVLVAVVDPKAPQLEASRTSGTVIGVASGAVTAEELAIVAASVVSDGRSIDGVLVADPDSTDPTTGRIPHMAGPPRRIRPTRVAGPSAPAEIRRRARELR